MAFPDDLSDVVVFKIHPAIGVARVSSNDDYYVFGRDPGDYKSGDLMKRQAVQFRIFAYGDNHVGLGELTAELMGKLSVSAVWSAKVANRKIAKWRGTPLDGTDFVISAGASSDDANAGTLVGSLPTFAEGAAIPLGQITGTGLFIPPKAGVFRETAGEPVPPYPARSMTVADTTCDGSVSVRLVKDGQELPSLPACILVAPQDFAPDTNPDRNLMDFLKEKLQVPFDIRPRDIHHEFARTLDEAALAPATMDFQPGFEASFDSGRSEVRDIRSAFYQSHHNPHVDPEEIRVRYRTSPTDPGVVPGQLTSGLCSPWQGDFTACVGYWSENLPEDAYLDEDSSIPVRVFRRLFADHSPGADSLTTGDDFTNHVDQVGVVRLIDSKSVETERDPGDDIP